MESTCFPCATCCRRKRALSEETSPWRMQPTSFIPSLSCQAFHTLKSCAQPIAYLMRTKDVAANSCHATSPSKHRCLQTNEDNACLSAAMASATVAQHSWMPCASRALQLVSGQTSVHVLHTARLTDSQVTAVTKPHPSPNFPPDPRDVCQLANKPASLESRPHQTNHSTQQQTQFGHLQAKCGQLQSGTRINPRPTQKH